MAQPSAGTWEKKPAIKNPPVLTKSAAVPATFVQSPPPTTNAWKRGSPLSKSSPAEVSEKPKEPPKEAQPPVKKSWADMAKAPEFVPSSMAQPGHVTSTQGGQSSVQNPPAAAPRVAAGTEFVTEQPVAVKHNSVAEVFINTVDKETDLEIAAKADLGEFLVRSSFANSWLKRVADFSGLKQSP